MGASGCLTFLLGLIGVMSVAAQAAPPRIEPWRYDEDYRYLRESNNRSGAWWEALKQIDLGSDVRLDLGGEFRAKYEMFQNDIWGSSPEDDRDYYWLRAMPYADFALGRRARVFGQFMSAVEYDDEDGIVPIDENRADMLQAFADLRGNVGGIDMTLRVGRQVLAYGSERLISTRYGPNVLQSFDVAKLIQSGKGWQLDLFYGHPSITNRVSSMMSPATASGSGPPTGRRKSTSVTKLAWTSTTLVSRTPWRGSTKGGPASYATLSARVGSAVVVAGTGITRLSLSSAPSVGATSMPGQWLPTMATRSRMFPPGRGSASRPTSSAVTTIRPIATCRPSIRCFRRASTLARWASSGRST